jgi:hypothetical protein
VTDAAESRLRKQDAWKALLEYNATHGFPYQQWELRKMHIKWRTLGKLARQPASLRSSVFHP